MDDDDYDYDDDAHNDDDDVVALARFCAGAVELSTIMTTIMMITFRHADIRMRWNDEMMLIMSMIVVIKMMVMMMTNGRADDKT